MSIITIDTAALGTIVQELLAEQIAGLGALFVTGRNDGIASLQYRLLALARPPAPAQSLAGHDDVIGPVAWHHQLPLGQVFANERSTRPFESLKQALDHLDQFGGTLEPLFKLREFAGGALRSPGGGTEARAPETRMVAVPVPVLKLVAVGASGRDYDAYVGACQARGVTPASRESFDREYGVPAAPEAT